MTQDPEDDQLWNGQETETPNQEIRWPGVLLMMHAGLVTGSMAFIHMS